MTSKTLGKTCNLRKLVDMSSAGAYPTSKVAPHTSDYHELNELIRLGLVSMDDSFYRISDKGEFLILHFLNTEMPVQKFEIPA